MLRFRGIGNHPIKPPPASRRVASRRNEGRLGAPRFAFNFKLGEIEEINLKL